MTRKKPWNRINLPVYSISSSNGDTHNMNIITYASQISMHPKRYICGVYHDTQTLYNLQHSDSFVLQLLSAGQHRLVQILGKRSGKQIDKIRQLEKRKATMMWNDFYILQHSLAVMHLTIISSFDAGDHTAFLCDVTAYKNINEGLPLTLDDLRKHGLIRI